MSSSLRTALSSALNQTHGDSNAASTVALAIVEYDRASADLLKAQKVAERRTGTRGANARKALLAAEARAQRAEDNLSHPQSCEDAVSKAQEMMSEVQVALDAVGTPFLPPLSTTSHI